MLLPLKYYGDPVLRKRGERVEDLSPAVEQLIEDMFETMAEYNGIGLAAQQVGEALQEALSMGGGSPPLGVAVVGRKPGSGRGKLPPLGLAGHKKATGQGRA